MDKDNLMTPIIDLVWNTDEEINAIRPMNADPVIEVSCGTSINGVCIGINCGTGPSPGPVVVIRP